MEALRWFKYWGVSSFGSPAEDNTLSATIVAAAKHNYPIEPNLDTDDEDEDGPSFNLEFAISEEHNLEHTEESDRDSDKQNEEVERLTLSSMGDGMAFRAAAPTASASKLSIFELGFINNPKMNLLVKPYNSQPEDEEFVEIKIEEVPVVSLIKENSKNTKSQKQNACDESAIDSEEKRMSRDITEKYLKKSIFSRWPMTFPRPGKSMTATTKVQPDMDGFNGAKSLKQVKLQAGWRTTYTNLDETQSASSATVTVTPSSICLQKMIRCGNKRMGFRALSFIAGSHSIAKESPSLNNALCIADRSNQLCHRLVIN